MNAKKLIEEWFEIWERGNFEELPISDDFKHTSPFGTISGKEEYLNLVRKNKDKFLSHKFKIHDILSEAKRACVRYTAIQSDFSLDVSEWHYISGNKIIEIIAYYHIGNIREDRKLS